MGFIRHLGCGGNVEDRVGTQVGDHPGVGLPFAMFVDGQIPGDRQEIGYETGVARFEGANATEGSAVGFGNDVLGVVVIAVA